MSKEKKIIGKETKEIFEILVSDCGDCSTCICRELEQDGLCVPLRKAEELHSLGYRKEIDVAEEIFAALLEISSAKGTSGYLSSLDIAEFREKYRKRATND